MPGSEQQGLEARGALAQPLSQLAQEGGTSLQGMLPPFFLVSSRPVCPAALQTGLWSRCCEGQPRARAPGELDALQTLCQETLTDTWGSGSTTELGQSGNSVPPDQGTL